jgi:cell wall-associated NlpC family hydrolase
MPAQSQPVKPAKCARQANFSIRQNSPAAILRTRASLPAGKGATLPAYVLAVLLSACSSAPPAPGPAPRPVPIPSESDLGALVAHEAAQLIGTPYRYGGDDLRGFDCSGLVFYTHDKRGIEVPRTADAQSRAATPVSADALVPGDLIFFRISSRKVDHVGIYAGNGRFIHAPSRGQVVSMAYLDDPYYRRHMTGAGRFWRASARP